MTRTERLLRLARLRGDRAAIAILEAHALSNPKTQFSIAGLQSARARNLRWTEAELRAAWGDR